MHMKEKLKEEVYNFLTKGDRLVKISKDENLFKEGYIDSFGIMELIDLIEELLGEEFNPDILVAENFSTLGNIYKMIEEI